MKVGSVRSEPHEFNNVDNQIYHRGVQKNKHVMPLRYLPVVLQETCESQAFTNANTCILDKNGNSCTLPIPPAPSFPKKNHETHQGSQEEK